MEVTKQEATKMLIEMATYIDLADVIFDDQRFNISNGVVQVRNRFFNEHGIVIGHSDRKVIATVSPKEVDDIVNFLTMFIPFSKATSCIADPIILNTPDPDWRWVINARAYCSTAMVRYMSNKELFVFDPDKDADRIMQLGFKKTFPNDVLELF